MFDVTERARTGLNLLDSDNVNRNYVISTTFRVLACNEGCLIVFRNGWKINRIGAYDISNKKYSDSAWKEKLWGQIGEELKKPGKFQCSFIGHIEVTIILLSPKF